MSELLPATGWPPGFTAAPVLLLVDDEPNVLSALRRLLRPSGYQLHLAGSGAEALELLSREPVDLIVSDMRMPGLSGAELLAQARARWPDTLRILLTGYAEVSSAIAAINEGGIYRYIAKPWNDEELLKTLQQALELRGLQAEKQRLEALTAHQNAALRELNATLEDKVRIRTEELRIANQEISLAMEKLRKTFFTSVQVLSNLIEMRAPALAGHSRRVADVARKLAEKMGLGADLQHEILLAGLLHDIGKIGYPDALFGTPLTRMNSDELGIARKHPINGAAALMSMPDMRGVADIIRSHHERWDGQGFPDALTGEKIPLGARILALANDYDGAQLGTLSAKRMTPEEAKQWVIEGRKFRYDPDVVDAFGQLIGKLPRQTIIERRLSGAELEAGMVLSRDLHSPDGMLLLATEYVLDDLLIRQIRDFEESFGRRLVVCVRV
ncbi:MULTISPECIES: HD domain-containing phosphohydrolase [Uliginosibacterium]|uniref:Response regulator n=1 Tax=Uliginosibacterium aquaticum TaxID=2731212 RepID=A0ABX2IEW7_9RHOO|nr:MULTISPECIES: HD domain-containing phosphohydrolase [Uliginosibacterium]NSL55158.1 response regulator [Uliginosibacterium aquaticum]PLK48800.1 two-component system response regulator [Uliginosibacterium sp. TH139]